MRIGYKYQIWRIKSSIRQFDGRRKSNDKTNETGFNVEFLLSGETDQAFSIKLSRVEMVDIVRNLYK